MVALFVVAWFLNYQILASHFDLRSCGQQYEFWKVRSVVYECMFLILAIVCFISCSGISKALACFAVIMIAGSLADKLLFKETGYVLADIILVVVGLIVSVYVFRRSLGERKKSSS